MHRPQRPAFLAVLLLLAGCASVPGWSAPGKVTEMLRMYERADYFGLRVALAQDPMPDNPRATLLHALVAHAFNDPAASNRELDRLGPNLTGLSGSLRVLAHRLRYRNHFRLHEYAAAAAAAEHLFALESVDSAVLAEIDNELRLTRALADVPPQRVVRRTATSIPRGDHARVPIQIGDSIRAYVFDTGANMSVMMHSEAEALGLEIRETGVEIGTSTGTRFTADVAVAPSVRMGGIEIANVAFLVVPDETLETGPNFLVPGILGFPVLDALGEVEFRSNGVMHIPEVVRSYDVHNLALRFLMPLVQLEVLNEPVVCELDTGATHSAMFMRFYERMRNRIEDLGRPDTVRIMGIGGERVIPAWVLDDVTMSLGQTNARLSNLPAYTIELDPTAEWASDCRLGLDVLNSFTGYIVNVRSMTLMPLPRIAAPRLVRDPH